MSKHTPGPWTILSASNRTPLVKAGPTVEETVAMVIDFYKPDEAPANARLIAAAPEMLEALKDVDARLTHIGHMEANALTHGIVRAAIAKATGDSG